MGINRNTEQDILYRAIEAVERETGLCLVIEHEEAQVGDHRIDAYVRLVADGTTMAVEIKKWTPQANLGALIYQLKMLPEPALLAADYVNPNMAGKLRQQGVQYIDTAGNAYINQPPVYVNVTGKRQAKTEPGFMPTKDGAKRAFEPKGLMVVYAFLCQPELVNAPYRKIADYTGVAIGTIGWVINGLKAAGFIRERGKRQLTNYRKLLDRWVEAYPEKLKPKQRLGAYLADKTNWWQDIDINKYNGYWGGEIAAAKYTNYLKPLVATIYLRDTAIKNILADARLRKATEWPADGSAVQIYRAFWQEQLDHLGQGQRIGLVHPILAYADLAATGDPRNMEVAGRIYDEHIAQYCRED